MMKNIFGLLFLCLSCNNRSYDENVKYNDFYKEIKSHNESTKKYTNIIVISSDACESCVVKCLNAIKNNKKSIFVILTKGGKDYAFFKKKYKHTEVNFEKPNIVIDLTGMSIREGIYSGYPYLLFMGKDFSAVEKIELNALNIDGELSKIPSN